jgi:hypothetical protein
MTGETTLFESPPTTWKHFEAAVERLHYRTYWQRYNKDDTLHLTQQYSDVFWKQYPHLQDLDLQYGIEVYHYVTNTPNLNESKKIVLTVADDLLSELRRRLNRLARLWPVLEALVSRNDGKKYGRESFRLESDRIVVVDYDYELAITDELTIGNVQVEARGKHTREELQHRIDLIDSTKAEYERFLEPLRRKEAHHDRHSRDAKRVAHLSQSGPTPEAV